MVKLSVNLRQEIVKMFQTGKNQSKLVDNNLIIFDNNI